MKDAENQVTDIQSQIDYYESLMLDDDADVVKEATDALVTLRATLDEITRNIANAKGDLARAAAEAKKAAEVRAETEALA